MCVNKWVFSMLFHNGCRVWCLLLAVLAVAVSANDENMYDSTVFVNKDVVIADSQFTWIPDETLRSSWGIREDENGKWGFVQQSAPFCPVSQVSGSVSNLFDGDDASGFVWKAVSLNEKCPVDSTNCVEELRDGDVVALWGSGLAVTCRYNQKKGGKKCFAEGQACSEDCSFCDNLSASVVFDTEKLVMVQNVELSIQNAASAPRAWTISYSFEGLEGPFLEFGSYEMKELAEGKVSVPSTDGGVIAARYWKIEITSNWGADEVELKEVRLFGRFNKDLHFQRRLANTKEVSMDGAEFEATDYMLKYQFKGESEMTVKGYKLSVVRIHSIDLEEGSTGDKNTLVVGQPKTFQVTVSNHDNLENDRVKYVIGDDCSAEPFGEEFPVSANHTFTVLFEESTNETLRLCYRLHYDESYEAEEYFMIPGAFSLHMRDVYSITALTGASDFAVKGVPKVWRADVLGATLDDKVGFQINGECVMVSFVPSGFTFAFNYDSVEGDEVFPLCYEFAGETVKVFEAITVRVGHLDSLVANEGSPNVLISNFEKSFTVAGRFVSANDHLFLTSEADCATVPGATSAVAEDMTALVSGSAAGSLHVCYQFGEEAFYFSAITVDVYDVKIEAVRGAADVIVRDQAKDLSVTIDGPNAHLFSGFITLASESCSGEVVKTYPSAASVSVLLDFYSPSLVMCYTLSYNNVNEPVKEFYHIAMKQLDALRIENSDVSFIIAEKETSVFVIGKGVENGDRVFFVDPEEACEESSLSYSVSNSVARVTLPAGTTSPKRMCYVFGIEPAIALEQEVAVYSVRSDLNALSFNGTVAFFHFTVEPTYVSSDLFTFVPEDMMCPDALSAYSTVAVEGEFNQFLFESSAIARWNLCYYFGAVARFARFPSVSTLVIPKVDIETDEYANLAFTFVEKELRFSGASVSVGDRVKYVVSSCDEPDFNQDTTGLEYYTLDESMAVKLLFTRVSPKLVFCYSFAKYGDAAFYPFVNDEYSMRAVGMQSVTVNRGDSNVVISGVHKTFTLTGLEVGVKSFYFVDVNEACGQERALEDRVFELENNSALVIFAGCFQDMVYRMCVDFTYNEKAYVADMYSQTLEIVTFSSVSSAQGAKDMVVGMFPKPFEVEGCNLRNDDVFTVLNEDFETLEDGFASYENGTLMITAPVSLVGQEIRMAVTIRNEPRINLDASIFRASVLGVAGLDQYMFTMRKAGSIKFTTAFNVPYTVFFTSAEDETCANAKAVLEEPLVFTELSREELTYDRTLYVSEQPVTFARSTRNEDYYACVKFGEEDMVRYGPNVDADHRVKVYVKGVYGFESLVEGVTANKVVADKPKGY